MRRHAAHSPHASRSKASLDRGCRQFTAAPAALAMRRLPTPAGPASRSDGGRESCAIARDSSVTTRRWPMIEEKGTGGFVIRDSRLSSEDPAPETTLLGLLLRRRCLRRRRRRTDDPSRDDWRVRWFAAGAHVTRRGGGFERGECARSRAVPAVNRAVVDRLAATHKIFG